MKGSQVHHLPSDHYHRREVEQGEGGWDNMQWMRTGTKGRLLTLAKANGRCREEVVVVTMAERQVGIVYRRQMKLCGLGESMGGINN